MQSKILFVLGLVIGINIGYVIMIPSRNASRALTQECIDSHYKTLAEYSKTTDQLEACVENLGTAATNIELCVKNLSDCMDDLGLLQGRSK